MIVRRVLVAALLCGSVIAGTALPALSANDLRPNSGWNVTRISASQTGGQPYCALARRYDGGVVLTIARNNRGESSLAIDFQKTSFSNARDYSVELAPGYGQDRAFDIRPVSGKAVVVRLGQDLAFFDALEKSGRLAAGIDGRNYTFALPDMTDGSLKVGACLAEMAEPAAGIGAGNDARAPVSGAAASAHLPSTIPAGSVSADYDSAIAPRMESLRVDNERLRAAMESERKAYEGRLAAAASGSAAGTSALTRRAELLQAENDDLRRRLGTAEDRASAVPSCPVPEVAACLPGAGSPDAAAEMSSLRDENARLKAAQAAQAQRFADLENRLAAKVDAPVPESEKLSLQKRVDQLQAENKSLKASLASSDREAGSITLSQMRAVEAQLAAVESDRDGLLKQVEGMKKAEGEGLIKASAGKWDLEQATRRYGEATREIQSLGRQLQEKTASCEIEKKKLEYMLFDPAIADKAQAEKIAKLEAQVSRSEEDLNAVRKEFEDRIAALGREKAEAQSRIAALSAEKASAEKASADRIAALESRAAQSGALLEAQKKDYEGKIASLNAEKDRIHAQGQAMVQASDRELAEKVRHLEGRIAESSLLLDAQRKEYEGRVAALNAEKAQIQSRGQEMAAASDRELAEKVRVLESRIVESSALLETQRKDYEGKIASLNAEKAAAETQIALLRRERQENAVASATPPASAAVPASSAPVVPVVAASDDMAAAAVAAAGIQPSAGGVREIESEPLIGGGVMQEIESSLRQAGIALSGPVKPSAPGKSGGSSFIWESGALYGSAERKPMTDPALFAANVNAYLEKTRSRCHGDFASVPAIDREEGSLHVSSYELACIGPEGSASVAVLFYTGNGFFTALAHETSIENMDTAMDARDRFMDSLGNTRLSMR